MPIRLSDVKEPIRLSDIVEPKRLSDIEAPQKPKGLTYRPFANLRSMLQKTGFGHRPEEIERVMKQSKYEIEGWKQWAKGYGDAVSKGKIKEFQALERRLTEEKRNPIDWLEKAGLAGMAVTMGAQLGQMLEAVPQLLPALRRARPALAKQVEKAVPVITKPKVPPKEKLVVIARWNERTMELKQKPAEEIRRIKEGSILQKAMATPKGEIPPEHIGLAPEETTITQAINKPTLLKLIKQTKVRKLPMKAKSLAELRKLSKSRQAYEGIRKDISKIEAVRVPESEADKFFAQGGGSPVEFAKKLQQEGKWVKILSPTQVVPKAITPPITPPPVKPPAPTGEMPAQDPVQKIMAALREAKPIRGKQETLYTLERAKRFAKARAVGAKVTGEKGFYAELGQLKGELPKVQFETLKGKITQQETDSLFKMVAKSPNLSYTESISARRGLAKLFGEYGGTVPQEGEISLLNRVFGQEFTKTLLRARPVFVKIKEAGYQLANIPRSIMASYDLSFGFRQGLFLMPRYPKQFFSAFMKQFGYFAKEKNFIALQEEIRHRPSYELMTKSKLALTELGMQMTKREEAFMGQWGEKIPLIGRGVRASGRAYTGFANKFRADIFDYLVKKATIVGRDPYKDIDLAKSLANFINTGSGRGSLGSFERAAVTLNTFFFSPRLMASRLNLLNPYWYIKLDPFVRKEALRALFSFAGMGLTVLGIAKMAGAKVGTNLLSADAGKIKIGNTRIDIWAGVQQYIVPAARLITGQAVSSTTGRVMTMGKGYKPLTRLDIIQRGLEFKLAPVFSFATDLLKGRTIQGKPISIPKEVGRRFVPMALQDIYDIMNDDPDLLPVSLLGIFGVGLQTYGGRPTAFKFKKSTAVRGGLKLRRK